MMLRGVGQGGVNWLQNSVSQSDMEFLEGRKMNREEIYSTLAPGAYSMLDSNSNTASSRTGYAAFNALSIYPMHVMMAEKITNKILPFYPGRPLVGKFEDVRLADRDLELKEQDEYSKTHTIDEIREKYYGDDAMDDERGDLLPSQVTSSTGVQPEQPVIDPTTKPIQTPDNTANQTTQDPNMNDAAAMMARDELARWERKALKAVGRAVEFTPLHLPENVARRVNAGLERCQNELAIKSLFNRIGGDFYPMNESAMHLEGLKLAIGQLEKTK
jgi:hypothetical protein